jgi:ferric-dicitrate binding protein FerR (iron transport regulator)
LENITRNIIADLWPAYVSGDASPDTSALVEAFLREDPDFAQVLRGAGEESFGHLRAPSLTPDHELRTLAQLKRRLTGPRWLLLLAFICTAFAFGRLISDTTFDVSPRRFIASALVAASVWTIFLLRLFKGRREVLIRIRR